MKRTRRRLAACRAPGSDGDRNRGRTLSSHPRRGARWPDVAWRDGDAGQGGPARRTASVAGARALALGAVLLGTGAVPVLAGDGRIEFLNVLDDTPISFDYRPEQTITPAVEEFHRTAENPYRGDAEAIAAGRKIYDKTCKACHLADGTGRIGPSIVDDKHVRPRTDTDRGVFEILYAGGAGAMQAFGQRMDQDALLQVMAYLDELKTGSE